MPQTPSNSHLSALIVDFGGVLTTDIWPAFAAFCEEEGLEPEAVKNLFRGDSEALALLRRLEMGEVTDAAFEERFAALLGVAEHEGLIGRMFAGLRPERTMVDAVAGGEGGGAADRPDHELVGTRDLRARSDGPLRRHRDLR